MREKIARIRQVIGWLEERAKLLREVDEPGDAENAAWCEQAATDILSLLPQWKGIESHNGDSLPVLVGHPLPALVYGVLAAFKDATGTWRILGSTYGSKELPYEPTHWMPLPSPPSEGEQ